MAKKRKRRSREPVHITLDPIVLQAIDQVAYNRSRFIEEAVIMRLSHENLLPSSLRTIIAGRAGFEPAATGLKAPRSSHAELPALVPS